MGKVDTVTKKYLRQSSVFADIFNFYLYEGRQVINPEQLRELDPAELSVPYGADQRGEPVQRYRDLFKALSAMEDQRAAYLLLGIESQDEVHYAAPVRNLLYDALQYARQVDETARIHREKKDWFMTFPDFQSYLKAREQAFLDYENRTAWAQKMLVNISQAGFFSSDRTIEEYNRDIWKLD